MGEDSGMKIDEKLLCRFYKRVNKTTSCWLWTGSKDPFYGMAYMNGKHVKAHRLSWFIANGLIPCDVDVLHRCDVKSCVNPDHLFLGTHTDNMRDASAKGLLPAGENSPKAKITNAQAQKIRELRAAGLTFVELSKLFPVCRQSIGKICRGEAYIR